MDNDPELDPKLSDAIARLRDAQPERDLWPHIARHLAPRHARGTLLMRWPTALAAGIAIILATSASTAYFMHRQSNAESAIAGVVASQPGNAPPAVTLDSNEIALARAVNDLEHAVKGSLNQLDPEARATVTKTLSMLDDAIAQATARQAAAPEGFRAAKFLANTLRKKLQLLRTVSELTKRQS